MRPQYEHYGMNWKGFLLISGVVVAQVIAWSLAAYGVSKDLDDCFERKWCRNDKVPLRWSLAFQLLVMVVLAAVVGPAERLDRSRTLVVALLATSMVQTMEGAQKGLVMVNPGRWPCDDEIHIGSLLIGGFITMSVMNIVLMAFVGISGTPQVNSARDESCPQEQQQEQQEGYRPPSPLAL